MGDVSHECRHPRRTQACGFPGFGDGDSCELLGVGAGNQPQLLQEQCVLNLNYEVTAPAPTFSF